MNIGFDIFIYFLFKYKQLNLKKLLNLIFFQFFFIPLKQSVTKLTRADLTEADLKGAILTGATMPDGSIHN
ncbi:MAG: pentapeptide repeat-containing protein [Dolichospermum sp.]